MAEPFRRAIPPSKFLEGFYVLPSTMFYEPPYVHFKPGGKFLDIGASQGAYTIPAARFSSYVLAVEPDPTYADQLEESLVERKLINVEVMRMAISDKKNGMVRGMNLRGGTLVDTIDYLWGLKGPFDSIKIDIEGDEELAILGATKAISDGCVFNVEIHRPHPDFTCQFFVEKGYDAFMIGTRNYPPPTDMHYITAGKNLPSNTPGDNP